MRNQIIGGSIQKMRVYDQNLKVMYPLSEILEWDSDELRSLFVDRFNSPYIIMNFTGCYDLWNKEVYEGDILKVTLIDSDYNDSDEPRNYILVVGKLHWGNYIIDSDYKGSEDFFNKENITGLNELGCEQDTNSYEIIGNIYQNPKLATKHEKGN